jgi:hypothetical protein
LLDQAKAKDAAQIKKDSTHWQYLAETYGLSQQQITQALEREIAYSKLKPATVREALELFYSARQEDVQSGKLSKSTLVADRGRLVFLERAYRDHRVTDLSKNMILDCIHEIPGENGLSIFKSMNPFFKWMVRKDYLRENPLAAVDRVKEFGNYGVNNEFYPEPVFKRMLRIAAGLEPINPGEQPTRKFIDLLSYFVLGGFGGLRSCEAFRSNRECDAIRWTDLYFDTQFPNIEIREGATKKTNHKNGGHRHVDFPYAIKALEAWLPLVPRYEGNPFIVRWTKRKIQNLKAEFRRETGIKFTDNSFRNSFATYAFSYSGKEALGQVARQMRNSEAIAKRHYKRNLPAGSGRAWFSLRPFEVVSSAAATA